MSRRKVKAAEVAAHVEDDVIILDDLNDNDDGGTQVIETAPTLESVDLSEILVETDNDTAEILAMVESAEIIDDVIVVSAEPVHVNDGDVLKAIETDLAEQESVLVEAIENAEVENVATAMETAEETVNVAEAVAAERVSRGPRVTDRSAFFSVAGMTGEEVERITASAPKKVREKIDNLMDAFSGRNLSGYTKLAIKHALKMGGEFTMKDLVTAYEDSYSPGTARAQAQQMSALFTRMGICDKDGKVFRIRKTELTEKLAAIAS